MLSCRGSRRETSFRVVPTAFYIGTCRANLANLKPKSRFLRLWRRLWYICKLEADANLEPLRSRHPSEPKKEQTGSDSNLKIHAEMELRARGNEFFGSMQADTPSLTDSIQTTSVDSGSTGMQNFIRRS